MLLSVTSTEVRSAGGARATLVRWPEEQNVGGLANHFKIILEFTPITSVLNIDQDHCCVRLCLKIIYLGQGGRNWRDEALCDEGLWKLFGGRSNSSVEVCLTYKRLILSLT